MGWWAHGAHRMCCTWLSVPQRFDPSQTFSPPPSRLQISNVTEMPAHIVRVMLQVYAHNPFAWADMGHLCLPSLAWMEEVKSFKHLTFIHLSSSSSPAHKVRLCVRLVLGGRVWRRRLKLTWCASPVFHHILTTDECCSNWGNDVTKILKSNINGAGGSPLSTHPAVWAKQPPVAWCFFDLDCACVLYKDILYFPYSAQHVLISAVRINSLPKCYT